MSKPTRVTQYWQNKFDAKIIEIFQPEDYNPSPEWHLTYRRVRLIHHPESSCVFCEEYHTHLSALDDPMCIEVDLKEFIMWDSLYKNPDI